VTASVVPPSKSSLVVNDGVTIPIALVTDPRLTGAEVRCWAWLASRTDEDDPPSRRQIAQALDASMTQATRWLVSLERHGWISREERWAAPWGLSLHREPVTR
jgi:hypothetical protein